MECRERLLESTTKMPFVRKPSFFASEMIPSFSWPSGSSVYLLKRGAMIRGERTFMTSSKTVMAPKAQTHQNLPVLSMNQKRPNSTGMPMSAERAKPFTMSRRKRRGVVLLNPKRASMEKVEYREKGSSTSQKMKDTKAMKSTPWK